MTQESSGFAKDTREAAQKLIDAQPTAYDADKVLEQLEEECANSARMLNEHRGTGFEFAQQVRYDSYKKALEIVKGGGVNAT